MAEKLPSFSYPPVRLTQEQVEMAGDLSVSHATNGMVSLPADPEAYPAQGAYRMDSAPQNTEFLMGMGTAVYEGAPPLRDSLKNGEQAPAIHKMGELLTSGHNVIQAIPHSSLSDIGLAHGLPIVALRELDYDFQSAIIVSQGVASLGRDFNGYTVPLPDALGYMSNIVWFVYPRTDKTAESELAGSVPPERLNEHNTLVRDDMRAKQEAGSLLLTSAVNATSYIRGKDGEHLLAGMTPGTIASMLQSRTYVQRTIVDLVGADQPVLKFCGEPLNLTEEDEIHDVVGLGMAEELNAAIPDKQFIYLDPRQGLTAEVFQ